MFGMVMMGRVGQRAHDPLIAVKSSGVFQRAVFGAVDQPGARIIFVRAPPGNQLEPVKLAATKVVLVKRFRIQCSDFQCGSRKTLGWSTPAERLRELLLTT
ncbi:hypothetical protein [Arthrobacter sp. Z4-13]